MLFHLVDTNRMVQYPSSNGVTDICWHGPSFCVKVIVISCPTIALKFACFGIYLLPVTYTDAKGWSYIVSPKTASGMDHTL